MPEKIMLNRRYPSPAALVILFSSLFFLIVGNVSAATTGMQYLTAVSKAVENFARQQTKELPGQVSLSVGTIDPRLRLPACSNLETFLPAGSRLWGNSTVGVRCSGETPWTIYVPVAIKVMAPIAVTARPLASGQTVSETDVTLQTDDLTQMPSGAISDPAQVIGKTMTGSIAAGQPFRLDLLRAPLVIKQGQMVKLVAQGRDFRVSSEGKAMANAAVGQSVSVRTASGQVVTGIAKPNGTVEVAY